MQSALRRVFFAVLVLLPTITLGQGADAQLSRVFEDYHAEFLVLFPMEATNFGASQYNDQLQIDISQEFLAKLRSFYEKTLDRLSAIDASSASDTNQLMAEVLAYEVNRRLSGLAFEFERIPFHQFNGLPLTFAQLGSGASSQPFQTVRDYENWLARVSAFEVWCKVAIDRFREGIKEEYVLPRILVERMIPQMLDATLVTSKPEDSLFYAPIRNMPDSFSAEDRTRLTQAYSEAIANQIIPAYQALGRFLQDEYLPATRETSGISALTGGRSQYQYWVEYWTTTSMTPDEVFALGESEVARITEEMQKVRQQMGFEGDLPAFFEHLRTSPEFMPFDTPDEVIGFFQSLRAKLEPALERSFVRKPKTPFEIRRTESFREKTASAEYMPGSADGSRPGIFYCPIPNAKEYNITGGMESLFLHEALPGHHYQISLQQENEALPEFARFLWYGAYGEGWALYCESIGTELGLYTDPKQKIGALGDEMHRAIRLVVDVGMHWKGWTREEAIEYMMSHEQISRDGAVAEIERYMAFTGQALSYKVGQLKIAQLRRECEQRLGDEFSLPLFHEQVLKNGCLPLSVLQRKLENWDPTNK